MLPGQHYRRKHQHDPQGHCLGVHPAILVSCPLEREAHKHPAMCVTHNSLIAALSNALGHRSQEHAENAIARSLSKYVHMSLLAFAVISNTTYGCSLSQNLAWPDILVLMSMSQVLAMRFCPIDIFSVHAVVAFEHRLCHDEVLLHALP